MFGVVYGPLILTYYLQPRGAKLRSTAEGAHWFPFVVLGTAFAVLGYYSCKIEIASQHSGSGFWTVFMNPAQAPEITTWGCSRLGICREHTAAATPLEALIGGSIIGALGTYALIRQVWDR
jgi:hypothetical protein